MYDPQVIYEKLIESGNDWADKKSAFMAYDDFTKSVLSECIGRAEGKSMTERTESARNDPIYIDHLKSLGIARKAWLLSEVKYKSVQALADGRRTEASTRRAEANYNGLQK